MTQVKYYCRKCEEFFHEENIPNINKKHFCGETAKIIRLSEDESEEELS